MLAALFVSIAIAGCAGGRETVTEPAQPLELDRISLAAAPGTNDNWPVRVDLVRVRDATLVSRLLHTQTRAWFAESSHTFRQAHPEGFFHSWEVVPGTVVGPVDVDVEGPVAGVLFCETPSSPLPIRFERDGDVVVRIDDEGCALVGGSPSKKSSLWSGWWR